LNSIKLTTKCSKCYQSIQNKSKGAFKSTSKNPKSYSKLKSKNEFYMIKHQYLKWFCKDRSKRWNKKEKEIETYKQIIHRNQTSRSLYKDS